MAHLHCAPGQHDLTVSAYIIRLAGDGGAAPAAGTGPEPLCLVHRHKRIGRLMQVGGHVELDETPWAALAHEVREESGYDLDQLDVLQTGPEVAGAVDTDGAVAHPQPFLVNTQMLPCQHFHTDLTYALVARGEPRHGVGVDDETGAGDPEESTDLRWYTVAELDRAVGPGGALADVAVFYRVVVERVLPVARAVPAAMFGLDDPVTMPA